MTVAAQPQRVVVDGDRPGTITFVAASLVTILLVAWLALVGQPERVAVIVWWPVAGLSIGLGIRTRRSWLIPLAIIVGVLMFPLLLSANRSVPAALGFSAVIAGEMVLGTYLIRGNTNRLPALSQPRDVGTLLWAATVTAGMAALGVVLVDLAVGEAHVDRLQMATVFPRHLAAIMLLTPFYMAIPHRPRKAGAIEIAAQIVTVAIANIAIFIVNDTLPLSFLPTIFFVWAALRLNTFILLSELLFVAVVAFGGSVADRGPFSFAELGAGESALMLQLFQITSVVALLSLALSTDRQDDLTDQLAASESLYRSNFDRALAGMLIVNHSGSRWMVEQSNPAARRMFRRLNEGILNLRSLLGPEAIDVLTLATGKLATGKLATGNTQFNLSVSDDRVLSCSISTLRSAESDATFALQFLDVTSEVKARRLEIAELERAAEIQRRLSPGHLPAAAGWTGAVRTSPAREVGGDFHDVRANSNHAMLALGDVMGKGMGAGMLAAATRSALRVSPPGVRAQDAVAECAVALNGDFSRTGSFATLSCISVDLNTGEICAVDAGHGLTFLLRVHDQSVERLHSEDLPVGLGESWHGIASTIEPGDAILILSDGVIDLWGDSISELHDAIARVARRTDGDPQRIVDELCADANSERQLDDVTALIFRRDPIGG